MGNYLKFAPIFLPKIWGGNRIANLSNWNAIVPIQCGEVWLVSDVHQQETSICSLNCTLRELIKSDTQHEYFSKQFKEKYLQFPLLIKIIDAQEDLSIQVHPNDEIALRKHQSLGKSESWIILEHEENAALFLGWKREMTLETIQKASINGSIADEINRVPVSKNELFYIPAGLVHSIGKGIVLGEIQQSSDVTYRLFDFNRKDAEGNLRELHLDDSLDALTLDEYKPQINDKDSIASEYFSYSRHKLNPNQNFQLLPNQLIWLLEGDYASLSSQESNTQINKHEPVWIPNSFSNVILNSDQNITFLIIQIP
jgi:mannose-6-phosphate isomerase